MTAPAPSVLDLRVEWPWYASPWPDDWDVIEGEPIVIDWGIDWYSYVVLPR